MDHRNSQRYDIAWILSSPDHHAVATSFFDETYGGYSSVFPSITYSTGRVGRYNVVAVSKGPATLPRGTGDVVDNLLHEFPSVRAGFLVSSEAIAFQAGLARVGDVVVGTKPGLQSSVLYFDAEKTKKQKRLFIESHPKRIPEAVAIAVEALLCQEGRDNWLRSIGEGTSQHQRKAFRGVIASSTQLLDDAAVMDCIRAENDVLCLETTAANIRCRSLVVLSGIAEYSGHGKPSLSSAEVCKVVISYLTCLVRLIDPIKLGFEPPMADHFEYEPFDLDQPGFRLLRLEAGSGPIHCHVFQAYLDDREVLIPYEALSYCWGSSATLCHTILVNGKVLFTTANLFDALKELRRQDEDRILWIDAICIDQSNIRERGHQVGWMGRVYARADQVLFWLGYVEHNTAHLISSLHSFIKTVPSEAWWTWALDDPKWLAVWEQMEIHCREGRHRQSSNYSSAFKCLMKNEWFSRVWILQEVANARKAFLGCSEGWIDTRAFAMAPTLLGITPTTQCQAIIDIMPGPSRRYSWWAQKPDICALLWRFRESQASDPRDRLYALLGLASDVKAGGANITADYTKTEEAVVREIITYLFDNKIDANTVKSAKIADLQMQISHLSASIFDVELLSATCEKEVVRFMQMKRQTSWISETAAVYTWLTRPNLLNCLKDSAMPVQITTRHMSDGVVSETTTMLASFLESQNEQFEIPDTIICMAIQKGYGQLQLLLNRHSERVGKITEYIVELAAKTGSKTLHLLFDRCIDKIEITKPIIKAAVQNGHETLRLLLDIDRWGNEFKITESLTEAAARNGSETLQLLLNKRGDEVKITESLICAAASKGPKTLRVLADKCDGDFKITKSLINRVALNRFKTFRILLGSCGVAQNATERLAEIAAQNGRNALKFVLDRLGDEVKITETLIYTAARNGHKTFRVLLDRRSSDFELTDSLVTGITREGVKALRLLLNKFGDDIKVTGALAKAAAQSGYVTLQLLLDKRGNEVKITESLTKAAAQNGQDTLRLLLDRCGEKADIDERSPKKNR
ncbi:hypothetical protein EsH8_X_000459 [Colletotrichum jinshuiense]